MYNEYTAVVHVFLAFAAVWLLRVGSCYWHCFLLL